MSEPVVRLTANLTVEVAQQLDELAKEMNTTRTQALNQAIAATATLYRETKDGGRVTVKDGNVSRDVRLPRF